MSHLIQYRNHHQFRMEFFPDLKSSAPVDKDIPGVQELESDSDETFDDEYNNQSFDETFDTNNNMPSSEVTFDDHKSEANGPLISNLDTIICTSCNAVQSEIEKYMKTQDVGLNTGYKCQCCRDCRDCLKGPAR